MVWALAASTQKWNKGALAKGVNMSRPIKHRKDYLSDTLTLTRILKATQADPIRSAVWKREVLKIGQALITKLNKEGVECGGSAEKDSNEDT